MDSQIFVSEKDYKDWWPANHITPNPNITQCLLEFHENYELNMPEPLLHVQHSAADAELIRKKIYISEKFKNLAHQIYASQYFETDKNRMNYILGFERSLVNADYKILEMIKTELVKISQVSLIK